MNRVLDALRARRAERHADTLARLAARLHPGHPRRPCYQRGARTLHGIAAALMPQPHDTPRRSR